MTFEAFLICIIISFIAVLSAVVPLIVGKVGLKRALRPIEFYPPRGYSPIDFAYKYYSHRIRPRELINPLMLYWASRGFITIEEDCKRGLKLTKLKEPEPPSSDKGEITDQMADNFRSEKALFDGLFDSGNVFYTLAAPSSIKNINKNFIDSCKHMAKERRTQRTDWSSGISLILAELSIITVTLINYAVYGDGFYAIMLFPIIAVILIKAIPNDDPIEVMIKYPFICVWGGAPLAVVLSFIPPDSATTIGIGMALSVITVLLSQYIDIRSERDIEIYGRISAFKQFLIEAEKDRLEILIEENPNYYYDILPYCYILKITDKLKEKFDNITTDGPGWYLGDLRDTLMF